MATIDYSAMSDADLLASLPPGPNAAPVASTILSQSAAKPPLTSETTAPGAPVAVAPLRTPPSGTFGADASVDASPSVRAAPGAAQYGTDAAPDFSRMSDEDLLASLSPRAAPAPDRSTVGAIGHQLGLTARAAVQGAAALPGMVSDAVTGPINAGLDAVRGEGNGFRFQKVSSALGNIMDKAGVAQPENATERVVQDAATGAASAASGVGTGQILTKATGPISRALGTMLSAGAGTQIVSGAAGAGAAGVARESGGGALAQGVAGVVGALAPSAASFAAQAAIRGAVRGGQAGRQQVADNLATFEGAAGTTPTLGQATQSRVFQGIETGLANIVGGSGIMVRKAEQQAKALQQSVQDLADRLSPGATATDAGEAIARGVNTFRDNVKVTQQRLYNQLDRFIAPNAPTTVSNTSAAMKELNAGIDGAENLSKWFRNAQLSDLEKSLLADLQAAGPSAALPYEAVKKLRTLVGRTMSDTNMLSPITRDKWAPVYAALSEDLGIAAKAAGPQAEQAWTRANTFTRLASQRMEQISSIVNRDAPEHIFKAATSGLADGGTQIRRLMKSMPVENRREVAAAVLQRLGRAKNSAQDELGTAFSSETFLSNLAALSPGARKALFSSSGFPGLEQRVNQMGRMASVRREGSTVFANPSGTARLLGLGAWASQFGAAIWRGDAAGIAAALAVPAATNVMARAATSGKAVKFLSRETELSDGAIGSALAAAGRTGAAGGQDPKSATLDGGQPFQNRMRAGAIAREQGGHVMRHPGGGFVVLPGAAP